MQKIQRYIYGAKSSTPNMHLHIHLKDSLLDYGPVYAFWLFAFECFNGILGAYSSNNKNIEVQIMRKFIDQQKAKDLHLPEEFMDFCKKWTPNLALCFTHHVQLLFLS